MDQDDRDNVSVWKVARDDQGNAVLAWMPESYAIDPEPEQATDELAQTYSHLRRLELPTLVLEGESPEDEADGFDPYNTGSFRRRW